MPRFRIKGHWHGTRPELTAFASQLPAGIAWSLETMLQGRALLVVDVTAPDEGVGRALVTNLNLLPSGAKSLHWHWCSHADAVVTSCVPHEP